MTATTVSLTELVDLSLGTPEVVNYKGLRTLLLAIVGHLKLGDVKTELKDTDKQELLAAKEVTKQNVSRPISGTTRTDDFVPSPSPALPVRSHSPGLTISQASVSDAQLQSLEHKVSKLENQMEAFNALPSNEDLLQRVKSSHHEATTSAGSKTASKPSTPKQFTSSPVTEMWQLMQVQRIAAANEEGVGKLMSMVEDMMRNFQDLKDQLNKYTNDMADLKQQLNKLNSDSAELKSSHEDMRSSQDELKSDQDNINERLSKLESSSANEDKMSELQKLMNDINNRLNTLPPIETVVTWPAMEDALKGIYKEPAPVSDGWIQTNPVTESTQQQTIATSHEFTQTRTPSPPPRPSTGMSSRPGSAISTVSHQPTKEIQKILKDIGELSGKHVALDARVKLLEELMEKKADLEEIKRLLGERQDVPEDLAKMLADLQDGLDSLHKSKDKDGESITEMQKLILQMQAEVDRLNTTYVQLVDEHNAKQKHIDALYTFVDRLQENKADKEHVTMEIDIKADKRMLENKVSRSQFQGTVDEMTKNLNDVMSRLSGHTDAWESAVSELKLGIDNKLDRMELDPLKAYLDRRIKAVDAKVIKKDMELPEDAAGFRRPLQKFNCISCDRPLDMSPQPPLASLPENKGLPGMRSGRPYTTFELEQIRAAQKKCGSHYGDVPDYFVTTRSCGGSHTMTYPHKRVTRTANTVSTTLTAIVPTEDLLPMKRLETDIQGADGHIYRARVSPGTDVEKLPNITNAPKSPKSIRRTNSARGRRQPPSSAATERTSPHPTSGRPHSARISPRSSTHNFDPATQSNTLEVNMNAPSEPGDANDTNSIAVDHDKPPE